MNYKQKCILKIPETESLVKLIKKYGKVKVTGLGIFEVRKHKARRNRNIVTGEMCTFPAFKNIKFIPTKGLKDYVNS